jgi:hypothetical protein
MMAHVTMFSEIGGRRTLFVGEMDTTHSGWDASGDSWPGDTVNIESKNGTVKIGWVDEEEEASETPKST